MIKDRDGTELKVDDWVKRVSEPVGQLNVGDVVQISSVRKYDICIDNMGPFFPERFVKVQRHPHADIIIAAANDMNVEVEGNKGTEVFRCMSFYGEKPYLMTDHTVNPPETPNQKEIKRIEAEMRKLSDDIAKLRED